MSLVYFTDDYLGSPALIELFDMDGGFKSVPDTTQVFIRRRYEIVKLLGRSDVTLGEANYLLRHGISEGTVITISEDKLERAKHGLNL